jgi:hypothetical protein
MDPQLCRRAVARGQESSRRRHVSPSQRDPGAVAEIVEKRAAELADEDDDGM